VTQEPGRKNRRASGVQGRPFSVGLSHDSQNYHPDCRKIAAVEGPIDHLPHRSGVTGCNDGWRLTAAPRHPAVHPTPGRLSKR
jgi:hypothetical protein